ncbi:putative ribonuclease H protein At1g65750 family [Senna tora]|uniref:Putative ribonuclease H protein At1g65750 family n=1 Tax=Senna tora TaxID=362788 RepID=A0A834XAY8_9FABA|nr:putative ribonuclease H protein At1g65750 family [Senna tora]
MEVSPVLEAIPMENGEGLESGLWKGDGLNGGNENGLEESVKKGFCLVYNNVGFDICEPKERRWSNSRMYNGGGSYVSESPLSFRAKDKRTKEWKPNIPAKPPESLLLNEELKRIVDGSHTILSHVLRQQGRQFLGVARRDVYGSPRVEMRDDLWHFLKEKSEEINEPWVADPDAFEGCWKKKKRKRNESNVWKGICKVWSKVEEGTVWNVGDGCTIRFWRDVWCPKLGALSNWASCDLEIIDEDRKLCDFVGVGGDWDSGRLCLYLPQNICDEILRLPPPNLSRGKDCIRWKHSGDGNFFVKTAYDALVNKEIGNKRSVWRRIWCWQGPQRIRTFLWLVASGSLLTNKLRFDRGMTNNKCCPRCGREVESILHALRDCDVVRSVWKSFVKPGKWQSFFNLPLDVWVERNLFEKWGSDDSSNWSIIFRGACWWLWKMRNEFIFSDECIMNKNPYLSICLRVKEIELVEASSSTLKVGSCRYIEQLVGWVCPKEGWIKCNTDGACSNFGAETACGGVLRDAAGSWLGGFSKFFGSR